MNQSRTIIIDAIDFRVDGYSPDGEKIIVSLTNKYSAEPRLYSLPVTCIYSFIADLQKLVESRSPYRDRLANFEKTAICGSDGCNRTARAASRRRSA